MSRPGSSVQAGLQAERILEKALPGKRSNVVRRIRIARNIAERIWESWKVGPWQWQLKHLEWHLDFGVLGLTSSSRYDQWRAIRVLLAGTGREDLIKWLENRKNNSYINVKGSVGPRGVGGRSMNLPRRSRGTGGYTVGDIE